MDTPVSYNVKHEVNYVKNAVACLVSIRSLLVDVSVLASIGIQYLSQIIYCSFPPHSNSRTFLVALSNSNMECR